MIGERERQTFWVLLQQELMEVTAGAVKHVLIICAYLQADLQASVLCDAQSWRGLDGDSLVRLYDDIITQLLDRQVPAETKTCRRRPSNAWFDDECRRTKRLLRSSERAARRAGPISDLSSPVVQAWRLQRRQYST